MRTIPFENHTVIILNKKNVSINQLNEIQKLYDAEVTLESKEVALLIPNPVKIDYKELIK